MQFSHAWKQSPLSIQKEKLMAGGGDNPKKLKTPLENMVCYTIRQILKDFLHTPTATPMDMGSEDTHRAKFMIFGKFVRFFHFLACNNQFLTIITELSLF